MVQNKWLKSFQNVKRWTFAEILSGQAETFPTVEQLNKWSQTFNGNVQVMVNVPQEMINSLTWLIYNTFIFSIPYYNNADNLAIHISGFIQRWWLNIYKWWELQVQIQAIINLMNEGKTNTEALNTNVGRETHYDNDLNSQGYDGNSFNPVTQNLNVDIQHINTGAGNQVSLQNLANMSVNANDTYNQGQSNTKENIETTRTYFNMDMLNKIQMEAQTLINPFIKKCAELFEFIDLDEMSFYGDYGFNIW